jgi:isopenicillin N synthase-like dioxygenase
MIVTEIPKVNLSHFRNGKRELQTQFTRELGNAFRDIGFVIVRDHGIPAQLIEDFYREAEAFFALETEVKEKYEIAGMAGQRGYTSFGKEHAKQSRVADLKEFFQIGQDRLPKGASEEDYPANIAVAERPDFLKKGLELFHAFENTGAYLLRSIARFLDLPDAYFDERIQNGNSILRAIHYPPITQEPLSAIRAEQHEDINLITLLVGASAGGLQVLNKNGDWIEAQPEGNEIVINVGDMLQRLTNNFLKSTTHRVVNPPRELWNTPRLSIPFFLHPRSEMDLSCLESCVSDTHPAAYEPITAGDYLDERLREIGLKK